MTAESFQAIETGFGYGQWLHGEAVAAGTVHISYLYNFFSSLLVWLVFIMLLWAQVMAVDMSRRLGWIDDTIVDRVLRILKHAKLPTAPPDMMTVEKFKSAMAVGFYITILHNLIFLNYF